jgi:uncharacterized protein YuzE
LSPGTETRKEDKTMAHIHISDLNRLLRDHPDWPKYDPDYDKVMTPLYIKFTNRNLLSKKSETYETHGDKTIVMDYDNHGEIVGIEII